MTDAERIARGVPALDREKLKELIDFYSRVEIRNIGIHGRESQQVKMVTAILSELRAVDSDPPPARPRRSYE